jgi:6-phosphofructokinase 1
MSRIRNVALITSGGDAPGINSAIYGMVHEKEINFYIFNNGYDGILTNEPILLNKSDLNCKVVQGTHILQTSRSNNTRTKEGRRKIIERLKALEMDALIVCGGDGSSKAAELLDKEGFPCMVIPMTIDNDIFGTDYTVGYDTAVTTIKIVLSNLHQTGFNMPRRIFMVEVFGADAGHLALAGGLAGGADLLILPEYTVDIEQIAARIESIFKEGKEYVVIVCSEGARLHKKYESGEQGVSFEIGKLIEKKIGMRIRHSVLGYIQRSGDPSSYDSLAAIQMGAYAIEKLKEGFSGYLVGMNKGELNLVSLKEVASKKKELNEELLKLALMKNMIVGEEF